MQTLHFLSGLPRTGSTVLASLLNQHPEVYASATSPLIDLLCALDGKITALRREYNSFDRRQELNLHRAVLEGFYQHIPKRFVFDKHRGWPGTIPAVQMFIPQPKIVCTVRPIAEVITSVLVLLEQGESGNNFLDHSLRARGLPVVTANRAMLLWEEFIAPLHRMLCLAVERHADIVKVVHYHDLVNDPWTTLSQIEAFAGLPSYADYDFDHIMNASPENDRELWGIPNLHRVRPKLQKASRDPEEILGGDLLRFFRQFDQDGW